jgi:hypothetical protein
MEELVIKVLTEIVMPVVLTIVLTLGGIVLNKLRARYDINITKEQEDLMWELACTAVRHTEEHYANFVKKKIKPPVNPSKLDMALKFMAESVPGVDSTKAKKYIEAALAATEGAGATGGKAL